MRSVVLRDEVEIRRRQGIQGGTDRLCPGIGDRPGRQTGPPIGIVGTGMGEIFFAKISIESRQPIDHRRIALQGNMFLQPIMEYGGDVGTFVSDTGLFFDH